MKVLNKLLFLFFFIGAAISLFYVSREHLFVLQDVSVQSWDEKAKAWLFDEVKSDINKNLSSLEGKLIWEIPLEDLMKRIKKDQRVHQVRIKRKYPNKIEVKLQTHNPIAMTVGKGGEFYPIARDGTLLPALNKGEFLDVPIVSGASVMTNLSVRNSAIEILNLLPAQGDFTITDVSEIHYSKKHGFSLVLINEGEVVRLGFEHYPKRLYMASKVIAYLNSEGLKSRVIDVRFSKKVVVRPRNAP